MSFKARTWILSFIAILGISFYWVGRYYSPVLISFVVEETLIRKAPDDVSPLLARERFRAHVGSLPGGRIRVERLLAISQRLEKTQKLARPEFERLLEVKGR